MTRKILLTNDDGINAEGIIKLAELAADYGDLYVIAPEHQCSGKSAGITVTDDLCVREVDFPVPVKAAYSINGMPTDCSLVGCSGDLFPKPDLVLSGINKGFNIGFDILYSGTIGAALEALVHGIPAAAFSQGRNCSDYSIFEKSFGEMMDHVLKNPMSDKLWNFNVPECSADEYKGIMFGCRPAQKEYFGIENFTLKNLEDGRISLEPIASEPADAADGTDLNAVLNGYASCGSVECCVIKR